MGLPKMRVWISEMAYESSVIWVETARGRISLYPDQHRRQREPQMRTYSWVLPFPLDILDMRDTRLTVTVASSVRGLSTTGSRDWAYRREAYRRQLRSNGHRRNSMWTRRTWRAMEMVVHG